MATKGGESRDEEERVSTHGGGEGEVGGSDNHPNVGEVAKISMRVKHTPSSVEEKYRSKVVEY